MLKKNKKAEVHQILHMDLKLSKHTLLFEVQ